MLYRDICKILGYYLFVLTGALAIPFLLAGYYEFIADSAAHPQPHTTHSFFWSMVISLTVALICYWLGRGSKGHLYRREGLASVVLIWFLTPMLAALPFYLSGTLDNPAQAIFEAASGFTTTGASTMQAKKYSAQTGREIPIRRVFCGVHTKVYTYWGTIEPVRDLETGEILYDGIEAVSKALLFWRSFTQWLGGMGIVVLFVAILPILGVGGKMLFHAEIPGPIQDSLTPRVKETAITLWKIYVVLSIIQVLMLLATNVEMDWLGAVTVTFATMSTGGFTIYNTSIGYFNNASTEWVILLFMVLAAINFSLYFFALRGKFYRLYEPEFILYLILIVFCGSLTAMFIGGTSKFLMNGDVDGVFSLGESIRHGLFQIVSSMTTTGFVSVDYDYWPYAAQVLMLLVMFFGGMSGSTAGGMKIVRLFMLFRIVQYKVESIFRPEAVRRFEIGKKEVDTGASIMVLSFFVIVISFAALSTFVFVIEGIDPETALSLAALFVNNIGIGFRMASPTESCAFLSSYSCIFSSLLMIFGRLEFFAVLAVLVPAFWRQTR